MKTMAEGRAGPLGPPGMKEGLSPDGRYGCVALPEAGFGTLGGSALPRRKALPHGVPAWVKDGAVFFVTICCVARGKNQLCEQRFADVLFEAVEFRQARGDWFVHLLVLMPDHLHALVSFQRDEAMKKVISNFKEITAKSVGIKWQGNFFDHRLRSDESFDEKASYLRMNPVRKGLVTNAQDWPYVWPVMNMERTAMNSVSVECPARPAVAPYPL